jgi:hypothetical protein
MENSTAASYETPCQAANDRFRPLRATALKNHSEPVFSAEEVPLSWHS